MNKLNIGSLIKAEMKRQNMSVTKMAELLNVHRQTIYDMLNRPNIDVERLADVSNILHKDFLSMIGSEGNTLSFDWCEVTVSDESIVISKKESKKFA